MTRPTSPARSSRSTAGWGCSVARRRVVVTGIGAVNAVGIGVPDFRDGPPRGPAGRRADHAVRRHRLAGEDRLRGEELRPDRRCSTRRPRAAPTATATSRCSRPVRRCSTRSSTSSPRPTASATSIGSGIGGLNTLYVAHQHLFEKGIDRFSPFWVPALIPNMGAAYVSIELGTRGPLVASCTACAASSMAVGDAVMYIRNGHGRRDAGGRRGGGRHADGHRRVPRHARDVDPQRRSGRGQPAVRPRSRRPRDRRGRRGARAGGAGARAGARCRDPGGGDRATACRRTPRTSPSPTRPGRTRRARS